MTSSPAFHLPVFASYVLPKCLANTYIVSPAVLSVNKAAAGSLVWMQSRAAQHPIFVACFIPTPAGGPTPCRLTHPCFCSGLPRSTARGEQPAPRGGPAPGAWACRQEPGTSPTYFPSLHRPTGSGLLPFFLVLSIRLLDIFFLNKGDLKTQLFIPQAPSN